MPIFRWITRGEHLLVGRIAAFHHPTLTLRRIATEARWHVMQDAVVYGSSTPRARTRGRRSPRSELVDGDVRAQGGRIEPHDQHHAEPRYAHGRQERVSRDLPGRRSVRGEAAVDYQHPHDSSCSSRWCGAGQSARGQVSRWRAVRRQSLRWDPSHSCTGRPRGENPMSPLSHHTFDSTHIAFGVVTAAIDHGPWTMEASVFNGREPDEDRWDSISARSIRAPDEYGAALGKSGNFNVVRPAEGSRGARPR